MFKTILTALLLAITARICFGQTTTLSFQAVLKNEKIELEKPLRASGNDSLTIQTLRFYLGDFAFFKNGKLVFEEKNYRLLDLETAESLVLKFDFPEKIDFDSLACNLGVDSATSVAGAVGGDLDPTRGMFWTWQSGYINFKLDGFSRQSPARKGEFQFHLGGYLPPFAAMRRVQIGLGEVPKSSDLLLELDLSKFFENVDWTRKSSIMSPCTEAVELSKILSKSFRIHVE